MIRKSVLVFLIGLALLAGPVAAACAGCCPQLDERTAVVTAGCCDCGQTLERPEAPDAARPGGPAAPKSAAATAAFASVMAAPSSVFAFSSCRVGGLDFSPSPPPAPRRL